MSFRVQCSANPFCIYANGFQRGRKKKGRKREKKCIFFLFFRVYLF